MTLEALKAMLTRHPFEPMRVKTSNGEVFEIRHGPSDKVEYVSYLHVASVETVTGAAA